MNSSFNPFPGLRPFEDRPEDIAIFFGRDDQVDELLSRLQQRRFVGVVGQSGCGKSSLVRAGLLPALHAGFMAGAGSRWRTAIMRPGSAPIEGLARALESAHVLEGVADEEPLRVGLTTAVLKSGARGLSEVARNAHLAEDENILIVVDQFEELFRFRYSVGSAYVSDEAAAFVKLLLAAAADRDVSVYVLITMRSDFIGDCAQFRDLPERLNEGLFLVPRLTRDQLREAIAGPVGVAGATMAPRLVNRLLNEIGDDPDQLPVLQHALMRTWTFWESRGDPKRPIDVSDYEATGGLAEALSRHGDEVLASLRSDRLRAVSERAFKALTELGSDNRGVRRPTAFAALCAVSGASESELQSVLAAFRAPGVSFLMPPADVVLEAQSVVDLTHEALMRNWARLRGWVEEEAESAKLYRRLCDHAELYAQGTGMLLADPLLSFAEEWREKAKPSEAWAERYGGELALVSALIDESRVAANAELKRKEKAAQRTRVLAATMSVVAIFAIVAAISAVGFAARARTAEAAAKQQAAIAQEKTNEANNALAISRTETARAVREAEIAHKQTEIALREKSEALAAEARALAYSLQVQRARQVAHNQAGAAELAEIDRGMYDNDYDNRVAGLLGTDAYASYPSGDARAVLLTAAWTNDALGRVAVPPWDLGAVADHGRTIVVLVGERQQAYGALVSGSLVSLNALDLVVLGRTPNVRASMMCGFDAAPEIALAGDSRLELYVIDGEGQATLASSLPASNVRALACLPQTGHIAYIDGANELRVASFGAQPTSIADAGAGADGIALAASGRLAAVTTSNGNVAVYDLHARRLVWQQRLLTNIGTDCSGIAGCGSAIAFTPDGKQLAWYDAGAIHTTAIGSAGTAAADASYACAKASDCNHPSLLEFQVGSTRPVMVADGGVVAYDFTAKKYQQEYNDLAGGQRRAVLDPEFNMYVTPYSPGTAGQPNPFNSGVAAQSFSQVQAPLLGTVPGPQANWNQSFAVSGDRVFVPGASGFLTLDLDHLRQSFNEIFNVSYRVRMCDSGDGQHAVTFDMLSGEVEVLDLASGAPAVIGRFKVGAVPVTSDKNHYYIDAVQPAYDPRTNVVTLLRYGARTNNLWANLTLRRYTLQGRMLQSVTRAQLLSRAGVPLAKLSGLVLSARGNYVTVKARTPLEDVLIRWDGGFVGRAFYIAHVWTDETYAVAVSHTGEGSVGYAESVYHLPDWQTSGVTSIPFYALNFGVAPDGYTLAYYVHNTQNSRWMLELYDYRSRTSYEDAASGYGSLPNPPDLSSYTGLTFSADGRYLIATYDDSDGDNRLAIYSVDPSAWARAACLMAGRSLTAQEFRVLAGDIPYHDGCVPFKNQMYRW